MVVKRSVSLSDEVATGIELAASEDKVSFSAWLTKAAEHELKLRNGLQGVKDWESKNGPLSPEELAAGEDLLTRLLSGVSEVASRVRRR